MVAEPVFEDQKERSGWFFKPPTSVHVTHVVRHEFGGKRGPTSVVRRQIVGVPVMLQLQALTNSTRAVR